MKTDQGYSSGYASSNHTLLRDKRPLLGHLDIELTERCNNACQHCYINLPANDKEAAERELTTLQWQDIIRQAADLGALSIRFTGGEPLLRPDFTELYLYTRRLGMQVILFTNARLITPDLADLLARFPPLKKLEISVYGMHPESYDAVALAPGAYTEFRRGIELLQERGIPYVVKSVLLPPNKAERKEFETWAATLPGMEDLIPGYSVFLDLRARRDSLAKNKRIAGLRFTPEEALTFLTRDEAAYRKGMAQFMQGFLNPPSDRLFNCEAGDSGCVDAFGNYQMCMMLRHPGAVYPLVQGTLREALTEFFPQTYALRATNSEYLRRCAKCFLRGLCEQ
ncbi:MAG: radical SAM protein, partial [Anaerolineae bacterium]